MKYARIVNNYAVDTRSDSPDGCFTPDIVSQFSVVPDSVVDGWVLIDGVWSAPVPHIPTADEIAADAALDEMNRVDVLKVQIQAIEIDNPITPRQLRELALIVRQVIMTIAPTHPPVHGLEVANTIDAAIIALRVQI